MSRYQSGPCDDIEYLKISTPQMCGVDLWLEFVKLYSRDGHLWLHRRRWDITNRNVYLYLYMLKYGLRLGMCIYNKNKICYNNLKLTEAKEIILHIPIYLFKDLAF